MTSSDSSLPSDGSFEHGTGGYTNHKCTCVICRTEWNAYMVRYRASNGPMINARRRAKRRFKDENGVRDFEIVLAEVLAETGLDRSP